MDKRSLSEATRDVWERALARSEWLGEDLNHRKTILKPELEACRR